MTTAHLETWKEFCLEVDRILEESATASPRPFYPTLFRGLGDENWRLETTLERWCDREKLDFPTLKRYYQVALASKPTLESFTKRKWRRIPNLPRFHKLIEDRSLTWLDMKMNPHPPIWEYFAYLRHCGLPSPLLDWTVSPYVAAFFALSEPPANSSRVAVVVLRSGPNFGGSSDAHLFVVGPYIGTHARHFLQKSRYSICTRFDDADGDYQFVRQEDGLEQGLAPYGEIRKLTLPIAERTIALRHLDAMNISEFSLYGSEDSLVRDTGRRELFRVCSE